MTADYVFTSTFSARHVADAAAGRVRRIHRKVTGTHDDRSYAADDPDLLLWIHAVHTEYALLGYERLVRPLERGEADLFVREQIEAAVLVGLNRPAVPATREALRAHIASVEGLAPTEPAREFVRLLLEARMPFSLRPFWALHLLAAAALLPEGVRDAYALPRWLRGGRARLAVLRLAFAALNRGFLLFKPVRDARAVLRRLERDGAR